MQIPDLCIALIIAFAFVHFQAELRMSPKKATEITLTNVETPTQDITEQMPTDTENIETQTAQTDDETATSIVEIEGIITEIHPVDGVAMSLNVANPIFDPWTSLDDITIEEFAQKFNLLTDDEKEFVYKAHREAREELDKRMIAMKPEENNEVVNDKGKGKSKGKHERFSNNLLVVYVMLGGERYEIELKSNDRVGTLRQLLAKAAGLPTRAKFGFNMNGGFLKPNYNSNTYLYTLGITNGVVINALELHSEAAEAPKAKAKAAAEPMPLGVHQQVQDEQERISNDEQEAIINEEEQVSDAINEDECEEDECTVSENTDNEQ